MAKNQTVKDTALLHAVTPTQVVIGQKDTLIHDRYESHILVSGYKLEPMDPGWLAQIARIPGVSITLHADHVSRGAVQSMLSGGFKNNKRNQKGESEALSEAQELAMIMAFKSDLNGLKLESHLVTIVITITGDDPETVIEKKKIVTEELSALAIDAVEIKNLQEQAARTRFVQKPLAPILTKMGHQLFTTPALARSFVFDSGSLKDPTGMMLGYDDNRSAVILDMWLRNKKRSNSNMVICGTSGVGKTTTASSVLIDAYAGGAAVVIVDPEREYRNLTLSDMIKGQWINAAGSDADNRINLLEVKVDDSYKYKADETSEDGEDDSESPYETHLRKLSSILQIYFYDLKLHELSVLNRIIRQIYNSRGIGETTDFSKFSSVDYPIMEDVLEAIKSTRDKVIVDRQSGLATDMDMDTITKILNRFSDFYETNKSLVDGHTTVNLHSDWICFDIKSLDTAPAELKRLQYFTILDHAFSVISKNREKKKKTVLVIDEAHLLLDSRFPDSAKLISGFARRVRKYGGSLILITQGVSDFLQPSIAEIGKPILNNVSYKFLMGVADEELSSVKQLFKLTKREESRLEAQDMGFALLQVGGRRIAVNVEIPPYLRQMLDRNNHQVVKK